MEQGTRDVYHGLTEVGELKAQDYLETVVEKAIFRGFLLDVNGSMLEVLSFFCMFLLHSG